MPTKLRIVRWRLQQDQIIVIGTNNKIGLAKELEIWFPNARLEAVELGIRISNG